MLIKDFSERLQNLILPASGFLLSSERETFEKADPESYYNMLREIKGLGCIFQPSVQLEFKTVREGQ